MPLQDKPLFFPQSIHQGQDRGLAREVPRAPTFRRDSHLGPAKTSQAEGLSCLALTSPSPFMHNEDARVSYTSFGSGAPPDSPNWLLMCPGPDSAVGTEVNENHSLNQQAYDRIRNVMLLP